MITDNRVKRKIRNCTLMKSNFKNAFQMSAHTTQICVHQSWVCPIALFYKAHARARKKLVKRTSIYTNAFCGCCCCTHKLGIIAKALYAHLLCACASKAHINRIRFSARLMCATKCARKWCTSAAKSNLINFCHTVKL